MEAFWFWLMKPLADLAFGLVACLVIFAMYGLAQLPGWVRRHRCKHPTVHETSACDAVCRTCGKNLGFIQKWRDAQAARPQP
jgi:hypothetical protein